MLYVGVSWSMRLWCASVPCGSWFNVQFFSQPVHASKRLYFEASALRFCKRTTDSQSYIHSPVLTPARPLGIGSVRSTVDKRADRYAKY